MLDQAELTQEIKFNREQLGSKIPKELDRLIGVFDAAPSHVDKSYANLLLKLTNGVLKFSNDLFLTFELDALPASAWNARNLLELWIWVKYCSTSPENARRFHEDALRDVRGLIDAHDSMCKHAGIANTTGDEARKRLDELALEKLGITSLDPAFERVSEAARGVGLGDQFNAWNKHLSKFAHPTAGLVIGVMHQDDICPHIQSNCTTMGLYFCGQCVIELRGCEASL